MLGRHVDDFKSRDEQNNRGETKGNVYGFVTSYMLGFRSAGTNYHLTFAVRTDAGVYIYTSVRGPIGNNSYQCQDMCACRL